MGDLVFLPTAKKSKDKVVVLKDDRWVLVCNQGHEHLLNTDTLLQMIETGKFALVPSCVIRRILTEWGCCKSVGCVEHAIEEVLEK